MYYTKKVRVSKVCSDEERILLSHNYVLLFSGNMSFVIKSVIFTVCLLLLARFVLLLAHIPHCPVFLPGVLAQLCR